MNIKNLLKRLARIISFGIENAAYFFEDSRELPLISVVVPVFNEERFVAKCLESVKKQSYKNFECIIVNDCSTDRSRAVIEKVISRDPRFRIIDHAKNKGLAAARNTGLAAAKGPYIAFLDSDDYLLQHSLFRRAKVLTRNSQLGCVAGVYTSIIIGPEDGTPLEAWLAPFFPSGGIIKNFLTEKGECPFHPIAPLLKTEIVAACGGFKEDMRYGAEDWDLWQKIMRNGFVFIPCFSYGGVYRQKRGSMVRTLAFPHAKEAMRLISSHYSPIALEEISPQAYFVYEQPAGHYEKLVAESKRLIGYIATSAAHKDEESMAALLALLTPGTGKLLDQHIDIKSTILQALARYHCLSLRRYIKVHGVFPPEAQAVLMKIQARIGGGAHPQRPSPSSPHERTLLSRLSDRMGAEFPAFRFRLASFGLPLTENERRLKKLKNRFIGRRGFIIANGPSLRNMDLRVLNDEVTIGCNGLFLMFDAMGFLPTFYTVEDTLVAEDRAAIINDIRGTTKIFPLDLRRFLRPDEDTLYINFLRSNRMRFPQFSSDFLSRVYWGGTVTMLNLQLAWYLGIREVYLIGADHHYDVPKADEQDGVVITSRSADRNHFHPDYFGPGFRYHDPRADRMEEAYKHARRFFEKKGGVVYNATIGGRLEVFRRVSFESLFRRTDCAP